MQIIFCASCAVDLKAKIILNKTTATWAVATGSHRCTQGKYYNNKLFPLSIILYYYLPSNFLFSYHFIILSSYHSIILSFYHLVFLPSWLPIIFSSHHPIFFSSCFPIFLSSYHPLFLPFYIPIWWSSSWCFIVECQVGLLSWAGCSWNNP